MLVQDFLQESAERYPHKVALVCEGQRLTYAQVDEMANRLANALVATGFKRGDRVVIYLPNSVASVVGIFAALKAGGVFVPVNPTTKGGKLAYILNNCRATTLLIDSRRAGMVHSLEAACSFLGTCVFCGPPSNAVTVDQHIQSLDFNEIQVSASGQTPASRNIDLDLACLIYTSGSTGEPKGVMCDHSNMVFAASSIISYLENNPDDIVINVLPLSFDYGLYQLLMTFKFGGKLVLEQSFTYPAMILEQIQRERVTGFPGVPTVFAMLLHMDLQAYDLSSLRYLSNTAAALPTSHIQQIREKFPWARLFSMYGLTETKRTLYLPPDQLDERPASVGVPIPGTEVWLVDESGERLAPGAVGELVVRGRHVMRGYWEDLEATEQRYRSGPLPGERVCFTGDLFWMDQQGYYYFVGRKDDIIKTRGEKVSPKEVENTLYGIPGVLEAAVVGVPDPVLGQAIKAFIVQDGTELSETQILAHCRMNLEEFMVPRYVEFKTSLPKTSSEKIKKKDLS